jgi:predicted MFS family arabinose efflux permease
MTGIAKPARQALRVLSLAYFVQATGALSVVGSLGAIAATWALSDAQAALLISAFGVTFALAAPLLQVALGHLPRRRQVLTGLLVFSGAAWVFALAPDYRVLLSARLAMGLGAALIGPVLSALGAAQVEQEQQGSAIATVLMGLSLSGLVGMPLAAWAAHLWGARPLFFAIGAAGLATAVLVRTQVPAQPGGQAGTLAALGRVLIDPVLLPAFLVVFFIAGAVYTSYAFIVPIIRDVFLGDGGTVSAAMAVLGVAGVVGNLFVVHAARRYRADTLLMAGVALLALDLALMLALSPTLVLLYGALLLWAFATDMVWPSQQRRILELSSALRGMALAVTASFVFAGIAFGSALAGMLYARYGYHGNLLGSLALLGVAVFLLRRTAGPAEPKQKAQP